METILSQGKNFPVSLALGLIQIYQRTLSIMLRAVFGNSCRFYPSCSDYARGSIAKFGLWKGIWYGVLRICKCHPFHPGGYDPVK
ncbi:MAG: membrane protein insertion efficiency factor YidD [candidate division Zixibacteria bacterium]|nr:membrane protein insertion efficiency factor YidD [candidate division Zixibacteria bacterium]